MGYDETEIIHYVIFGKKEELLQLPPCDPSVVLEDEAGKTEFRPIYLFWDKADEKLLQLYCSCTRAEAKGFVALAGSVLSSIVVKHIQNKYMEVFLRHPETLFLSEKAEDEIPPGFWKSAPVIQPKLQMRYAQNEALKVLRNAGAEVTLLCVLPEEFGEGRFPEWLLSVEKVTGVNLSGLFLLGRLQQKEHAEDILDDFYEETGLAGSFYPMEECKKLLTTVKQRSLLLDCFGLTIQQVGRPTFYIDGAGVHTAKEIRRMEGVCKACPSLRMHLDRAFLSAL